MTLCVDPVATHGAARAEALALVDLATERRWTWRAFDGAVNRAAQWLIQHLGPASGARVGVLARNSAEMLILQFGCVRAGAIFVPLNWRLAAPEVAALLADAAPKLLFADPEMTADGFDGVRFDIAALEALTTTMPESSPPASARRGWEEASTILYTSGTSGRPKGVMLSEANAYWGAINFLVGNSVSDRSVFLCDMPLFHTAGLFANSRTPVLAGGTLLVSPGFDPAVTLARLADPALGITHFFSVPQMAQMLWNQPGFQPDMLHGLHVYATGGAPNPAAQIERFVSAGIAISDGFGMSETSSNFGMPVGDRAMLIAKAGSIGLPYISVEARIVDDAGDDVPDGMTGELWVRSPSVSRGYWNQPVLTQSAYEGGWFKTGDAALRDPDGYYFIVDRKKDMFISGGENVYPAEVEAVLAELEAIAESAVIGVPDTRWGEVGCAYIVTVAGASIDETAIRAHCRERLAAYKVPKSIIMTDSIPRTATGKVQKHILRSLASTAIGDTMDALNH